MKTPYKHNVNILHNKSYEQLCIIPLKLLKEIQYIPIIQINRKIKIVEGADLINRQ